MNNADEIKRLTKYADTLKSKLYSKTPEKHAHRIKEYKEFISRELQQTNLKIDTFKNPLPGDKL